MDPGLLQHLCRHASLTPRGVVDSLAEAVVSGDSNERLLQLGKVVFGFGVSTFNAALEVTALLNHVDPLQWIGRCELGLEVFKTGFQSVSARRAPTARLGPFQRNEVPTYRISLAPTLG